MIFNTISIDSSTPEQCAKVRAEMEETLGFSEDPLSILLAEEQGEFDTSLALRYLGMLHK